MRNMRKILGLLWRGIILAFSIFSFTSAYTQEEISAYNWAYKNKITTQSSIDAANLNWKLTRQELAKMLTNYIENIAWASQTSYHSCLFPDEAKITPDLKPYTRKICSYWIMWTNWQDFRPTSKVNRAELWTAISRMLRWDRYNVNWKDFYIYHLNALKDHGIMNNLDNPAKSLARRWDTFIMLKRLADKFGGDIYMNWIAISNISSDGTIIRKTDNNGFSDYDSYLDNPRLSNALKDMKLRSTSCPNIFCQQVADDGTYNNQKHYYWNNEEWTMTLIPWVYYVSDCSYYDSTYGPKNNKYNNKKDSITVNSDEKYIFASSWDENIIYIWKDGRKYSYWEDFLKELKKLADNKWESDLSDYVELEIEHYENAIDIYWILDWDESSEELERITWVDLQELENLNFQELSKEDKNMYSKKIKDWINTIIEKNKKSEQNYVSSLWKIVKNIKDDKFWLKEKYKTTKAYSNIVYENLELVYDVLFMMVDSEIDSENVNDEEMFSAMFWLLWLAMYQEMVDTQYQWYNEQWAANAIDVLDGKKNKVNVNPVSFDLPDDIEQQSKSSEWRARDVARKNDLAQIQTAIIVSQQDRWMWPWVNEYNLANWVITWATKWMRISEISNNLYKAWMSSIPWDPNSSSLVYGLWEKYNTKDNARKNWAEWDYLYVVSTRNWVSNGGFTLMAKTETEWWSNWVVCENGQGLDKWYITNTTDLREVKLCSTLTKWNTCSASACTYTNEEQLRYILLY